MTKRKFTNKRLTNKKSTNKRIVNLNKVSGNTDVNVVPNLQKLALARPEQRTILITIINTIIVLTIIVYVA